MSSTAPADPLNQLIGTLTTTPAHARASYRAETSLAEGFQADVRARQHTIVIDEPEALGGTDAGASPIEAVLAGLVSCQAISYQVWAAKLGIAVDRVGVEADGDIDLLGFFGIDPDVRAGYGGIRLTVTLEGPESRETYVALADAVDAHCPVLDNLRNPVPVSRTLVDSPPAA